VTPAVAVRGLGRAALAPWSLRMDVSLTAGKRSRLSFVGSLSFFQLALQLVQFSAQSFAFLPQASFSFRNLSFSCRVLRHCCCREEILRFRTSWNSCSLT
jgi:hypothetical protein